jgi:L-alanine-DL-glutamate epimerase-like enolase superfamily enzyme
LELASAWRIARGSTTHTFETVVIRLEEADGLYGIGEGAPISRYSESAGLIEAFCARVDAGTIRFDDIPGSLASLDAIRPFSASAKCALDIALHDGAARRSQLTTHQFLQLHFYDYKHVTSFSIGIAPISELREKVLAAAEFPVLKIKLGVDVDRELFTAVRAVAPDKRIRVDANEGWKTKEHALTMIEWLALDPLVEFVEQPLPASAPMEDWRWLKPRSPLPIFADESFHTIADVDRCAECFHGVNVKLVKTGGISGAMLALRAARKAGLKTMLGCMIETSILISAAAQLAELADCCDLDGNLLVTNDPYTGISARNGLLSFADAAERHGLRVSQRLQKPILAS